jgi:hypothetical protein
LLSSSKDAEKVNMLTKRDRKVANKALEAVQRARVKNLRFCKETAGSWEELARWTGKPPHFLLMLGSDNPKRSIGEKLARSIEASLGLAAGWLDQP